MGAAACRNEQNKASVNERSGHGTGGSPAQALRCRRTPFLKPPNLIYLRAKYYTKLSSIAIL